MRAIEAERNKWKTTCVSTSHGLEEVLEERDLLKDQLADALDDAESLEDENQRLRVRQRNILKFDEFCKNFDVFSFLTETLDRYGCDCCGRFIGVRNKPWQW